MQNTTARARDLGITFDGTPGLFNAITDVPGVEVGHVSLNAGDGPLVVGEGPIRTGVTAVLPRPSYDALKPCAAGRFTFNGNGELTGQPWLDETGTISSPIMLTNTFAVGDVHSGVVNWATRAPEPVLWLFPVVGETFDGYLNDITGGHVTSEHAVEAIKCATSGPVAEGSVGGGTGMSCYGFKGGAGTASRRVAHRDATFHVGAYVQANFGARADLVINGVNVGKSLTTPNPMQESWLVTPGSGSIIVVVATDAPLLPHQCSAIARRATVGLARTGTAGSHHSGDIFLAFSNANVDAYRSVHPRAPIAADQPDLDHVSFIPWGQMDPFYTAAAEAVHESVINALIAGRTTTGRDGNISPGIPHNELVAALSAAGSSDVGPAPATE